MGCLLTLLALITPRVVIVLIWLFSDLLSATFGSPLWPLLGFVFLPYTTLGYMVAVLNNGQVSGPWVVLIVLAVLADLGFFGQGLHTHRRRR
ncbi:MAG: hypothetical protein ACOCR1_05095 [Planctomycetota bacterium]